MLPIPSDPNYRIPHISEDEFNNPKGDEDESLLATGAWEDVEDEANPDSQSSSRITGTVTPIK